MKKTNTSIKINNVNISEISDYSICRWAALQEAMELIGDKCDDRKVDFETVELKPLEILKYIDNTADIIFQKNFPNTKIKIFFPKKEVAVELDNILEY